MIKLVGMVLTVLSGLVLGRSRAKRLWDRAALLRQLQAACNILTVQTEARQPLEHTCRLLGENQGKTGEFFRTLHGRLSTLGETGLGQAWTDCACIVLGEGRDIFPFSQLGQALSTAGDPKSSISACCRQLQLMAEKAEDTANRDGNMWTGLGMALGAALAIVLV